MKKIINTILGFSMLILLFGCGLLNREVNCSPNLDTRKDEFPDMSFKNKFDYSYSIVGVSYNGVDNPDSLNVFKYIMVTIKINLPYIQSTGILEEQGYCYRIVKVDTSINLSFESKYLQDTSSSLTSNFVSIGSKRFTYNKDVYYLALSFTTKRLNIRDATFNIISRDGIGQYPNGTNFTQNSILNHVKIINSDSNLTFKITEIDDSKKLFNLTRSDNTISLILKKRQN